MPGWSAMVACNDWRNGAFRHCADRVEFLGPDGDIALGLHLGGDLRFAEPGAGLMRFGRESRGSFAFTRRSEWHGNWCWNRYWMETAECARLMRSLLRVGLFEEGACDLWDAIRSGERITARLLLRVGRAH